MGPGLLDSLLLITEMNADVHRSYRERIRSSETPNQT